MLYVVLFFLVFSLFLYVLLGGADYGAGIIELFSSKENQTITKKTLYRVMGPVWEANHIWIIIMIVILWIAFPAYYTILVVYLHIPLTLMLLGITLRGVAFVFRHYDAYVDASQKLYDAMFMFSSLVTPIFIGICFGALLSGEIQLVSETEIVDFKTLYIDSWLNVFSVLVGLFFAALCAFLSATLLIGEADKGNEIIYMKKAAIATVIVVVMGFVIIAYGLFTNVTFVVDFVKNEIAMPLIVVSGVLLYPLWISIKRGYKVASRGFAGLQVLFILAAALVAHFPNLIITTTKTISILEGAAPPKVIEVLGISLLIGGSLILPGVFHLFKSFKMIKIFER